MPTEHPAANKMSQSRDESGVSNALNTFDPSKSQGLKEGGGSRI